MADTQPIESVEEYPPIDPEQAAMLRLPVKCLPTVLAALRQAGYEQEARRVEEFTADYTDPAANAGRLYWLELARNNLQKAGEIEFDDDATISHSDDSHTPGQYVLGWMWVDDPEADDEDE